MWDLYCSKLDYDCLGNFYPWTLLIALLKTWTFSLSKNVFSVLTFIDNRFVLSALVLFEGWQRVAPVNHEVWPRSHWIALFRRAGSPRERNSIETHVSLSKRWQRVPPIAHTSKCQFSTFEKTKLGNQSTLSILRRKSFHQIVHDKSQLQSFGRCRQQIALFFSLSQVSHSRDFDFHIFSSPSLLKSKMIRSKAPLQQSSTLVPISLWLVLFVNLFFFAIASDQTVDMNWKILHKLNSGFHSSRVKFPLVNMSANWFLCRCTWCGFFWVHIVSIEQPIKNNCTREVEVTHALCRKLFLQIPSWVSSEYNKLETNHNESQRSILFDRTSILSSEQDWCRPNTLRSDVVSRLRACIFCPWRGLLNSIVSRSLWLLPLGSTKRKNIVSMLLKFWTS